jgi:hypothetical protein
MAITLNETTVRAVKTRLEADLEAEIAQINAAATDDFTIAEPAQVLDYIPYPQILTVFPTIGIGDGVSTFEDDQGNSATGRHELLVVVYLQNADQEALAWQLRRYLQAVTRVVLAGRTLNDTLSGAGWGTGLVRISPGPTLADNEDPEAVKTWMSWGGIVIWAKRDEE